MSTYFCCSVICAPPGISRWGADNDPCQPIPKTQIRDDLDTTKLP